MLSIQVMYVDITAMKYRKCTKAMPWPELLHFSKTGRVQIRQQY